MLSKKQKMSVVIGKASLMLKLFNLFFWTVRKWRTFPVRAAVKRRLIPVIIITGFPEVTRSPVFLFFSAYFRAFSKILRFFTKKVKKRPLRFLYIEGVNLRLLIKGGDF